MLGLVLFFRSTFESMKLTFKPLKEQALYSKAPNEDTETYSAHGLQGSRHIITEVLYRMSRKGHNTAFFLCSLYCKDGPVSSRIRVFMSEWGKTVFDYHFCFFNKTSQFLDIYIPILSLSLHSTPVIKYSGTSCTYFHSMVGDSGHSCLVICDTGLSQRPDTALDTASLTGHGKATWLMSIQQWALYKKTWLSYEEPIAVNQLLCPLYKGLIQSGYSFNKAFDSVEDP